MVKLPKILSKDTVYAKRLHHSRSDQEGKCMCVIDDAILCFFVVAFCKYSLLGFGGDSGRKRLLALLHQIGTFFQIFCHCNVICLSSIDCMGGLFAFQSFSIHSVLLGSSGGGITADSAVPHAVSVRTCSN